MDKENRFSRQLNPPPVETEPLKSISTTGKVSFTSIKKNRSQTVYKPVPSIKYHQENVTRSAWCTFVQLSIETDSHADPIFSHVLLYWKQKLYSEEVFIPRPYCEVSAIVSWVCGDDTCILGVTEVKVNIKQLDISNHSNSNKRYSNYKRNIIDDAEEEEEKW